MTTIFAVSSGAPPAAIAVHMCIGQVYGFSVFKKPLAKVLGAALAAGIVLLFVRRSLRMRRERMDEMRLKELASQERIALMQNQAKVEKDRTQLQMQNEIEHTKLAVDIGKHSQQMSNQKEKPTKGK